MIENPDTMSARTDIMVEEESMPTSEQIDGWKARVASRRNELFGSEGRALRPKRGITRVPNILMSSRNAVNLDEIFERPSHGQPASEVQHQGMDAVHGRFVRSENIEE